MVGKDATSPVSIRMCVFVKQFWATTTDNLGGDLNFKPDPRNIGPAELKKNNNINCVVSNLVVEERLTLLIILTYISTKRNWWNWLVVSRLIGKILFFLFQFIQTAQMVSFFYTFV